MEFHLTARECHLPYEITQCYLSPDTSEHTSPWPNTLTRWHTQFTYRGSWLVTLITYRDGLSVHRRSPILVLTQQCTAGNRTRDLLITFPTPYNHFTAPVKINFNANTNEKKRKKYIYRTRHIFTMIINTCHRIIFAYTVHASLC